ncbi:META domain-containing protein [Leisingera aquimarina]|uniref:META domain-containing protein n=1 Tax=Leisingera aquimarina TaxID=476529 RepID=UPI00316ADCD9
MLRTAQQRIPARARPRRALRGAMPNGRKAFTMPLRRTGAVTFPIPGLPCVLCAHFPECEISLLCGNLMLRSILICLLVLASACTGDETLSAYGAADKTWRLSSIDNAAFPAIARLAFPEPGKITGHTPCNSFQGAQTAPYPWFSAEAFTVTRAACPELALETEFLQSLQTMTLAEVSGDVLILSNGQGREMLFTAGG